MHFSKRFFLDFKGIQLNLIDTFPLNFMNLYIKCTKKEQNNYT